jgi:hypothetical protein
VIDVVFQISRVNSRNDRLHTWQLFGSAWPEKCLRCWDESREVKKPGKSLNLGVGGDGAFSQNGEKANNVELEAAEAARPESFPAGTWTRDGDIVGPAAHNVLRLVPMEICYKCAPLHAGRRRRCTIDTFK